MRTISVLKLPGTVLEYDEGNGGFAMFLPLLRATDGLTLSQICSITGLEPSTLQNWIKRGFVPHPIHKRYGERQLARILLISALRDCMRIDDIGELMVLINGDTEDESDDIISEPQLYDILCACIRRVEEADNPQEAVIRSIAADLAQNNTPHDRRLQQALTVMIYAYLAGKFQKQTEQHLKQLKKL